MLRVVDEDTSEPDSCLYLSLPRLDFRRNRVAGIRPKGAGNDKRLRIGFSYPEFSFNGKSAKLTGKSEETTATKGKSARPRQ
jgi:hypothetical protein